MEPTAISPGGAPDERRAMFDEMVAEMRRHLEAHGLDVDLIGWEVTS